MIFFGPLCKLRLPYRTFACPGSLGPKAFTIGGENTTLKKYKIMNSELHTKININL